MEKHYSPIHSNNLTNHLPMFRQSLQYLGLSNEIVNQRCEDYLHHTPLKDLNNTAYNPTTLEKDYLIEYKNYLHQLKNGQKETCLLDLLNSIKDSLDAHLYHGLIRLDFAVKENNMDELAKALAFFKVISQRPLESTKALKSLDLPYSKDLKADWNSLMDSRQNLSLSLKGLSMDEKLQQLLSFPDLKNKLTQLQVTEDTEKRIAFILGLWFLKTRDFYVVHVVNAYNALTSLKPYIKDYNSYLNAFWQKAQLYCLITDERLPVIKIQVKPWDTIFSELPVAEDVHDIKLIYSCKALSDRFNLKIFNKIAHIVSHKYWLHQ